MRILNFVPDFQILSNVPTTLWFDCVYKLYIWRVLEAYVIDNLLSLFKIYCPHRIYWIFGELKNVYFNEECLLNEKMTLNQVAEGFRKLKM